MRFDAIRGQKRAVERLRAMLAAGKVPSALLFHGPEGVGKRLAARALATALACQAAGAEACGRCASCMMAEKGIHPDIRTLDAAYQAPLRKEESQRDPEKQREWVVDAVRELRSEMERRSMSGGWKTAIVDDAHRMTLEAQNALLKMLEEPPPRTLWVLVTGRRERLLPTILSRTQPVFFPPLEEADVRALLEAEGLTSEEAASLAALSEGSARNALDLREAEEALAGLDDTEPLAPYRLSEKLPRELMPARRRAQLLLEHRLRRLRPRLASDPRAPRALRALLRYKRLIDRNVSPHLVLELATLRFQNYR